MPSEALVEEGLFFLRHRETAHRRCLACAGERRRADRRYSLKRLDQIVRWPCTNPGIIATDRNAAPNRRTSRCRSISTSRYRR